MIKTPKTTNIRFRYFLFLTLLYALLIFYLSSIPNMDEKEILNLLRFGVIKNVIVSIERSGLVFLLYPLYIFYAQPDKLAHIILYTGFGLLLYSALKNSSNPALSRHAPLFTIIIGILYGVLNEYHQLSVPGRRANPWDVLADGIGLAIALAFIFMMQKLRFKPGDIFGRLRKKTEPRVAGNDERRLAASAFLPLYQRFINSYMFKKIQVFSDLKSNALDLKLAVILIILSIIFILVPPFDRTFLRIILALPLLLFLPGYLLISVMFPKRGELTPIERFTLSIGLSIAITVFDGFALNYTPWGFRPNSIVLSLSVIMGILLIAAHFQRRRLKETGYSFSYEDLESFYHTLTSKETETGAEYDPALEKTLIRTMVFLIILVSAVVIYANVTREPEKFTAFYILGSKGMAEDYPDEVYINAPTLILAGIENHEYEPENYTLRVIFGGQILTEREIYIKHDTKWLENVTFTPTLTSSIALAGMDTKTKLEFVLLKDKIPYRTVHLWVKPVFNTSDYAPEITIANGNMEQASGWNFSGNGYNITGSYTNISWVSLSHSYGINVTSNVSGEFGEIYQNLSVNKETIAIISFYVKDSATNVSANISKQVLLDNKVVWEAGTGNKSWEKIQIPVFFSKDVRLAFRVFNKKPVNDTFQVLWDDITIEQYTNKSAELVPGKPVPRYIQLGGRYSQDAFMIRGMPFNANGNVTIDGANFPGIYYDIDDNKSYEELNLIFSDNGTIDAGNATYISKVNREEISLFGSRYKLINKSDAGFLSRVLLKDASKTLNLSEKWAMGNDFFLSLDLISSKTDRAILELRKGNKLLDSKIIAKGGIFEYRTTTGKNTTTVFKTKIDSISLSAVKVKDTELYSDTPTILKIGDSTSDFEITNISYNETILKNLYPIEINDSTMIMDGSIRFRAVNDMIFPYAASGEIRGIPQTILPGSHMNINGLNFPGFFYDLDNKTSLEELSMDFSYNATVDIGKAVYKTNSYGSQIYFMGDSYGLPNPNKVSILSGFSTIKKTIPRNGTLRFENGYILILKEKPENSSEIFIKKEITKAVREQINKTNDTRFFKDDYYEMFTTTLKNGRLKSNILYEAGDKFDYMIEYGEDKKYNLFSGKIVEIDTLNVTMEIRQYQKPIELLPGMRFGEFEVESAANYTITLRNIKPIRFEPGKETPILSGAIRIRTSAKEPVAYPIAGK